MLPWHDEDPDHVDGHSFCPFLSTEDEVDFNIIGSPKVCLMHIAIFLGNTELIQVLIDQSKDININIPCCSKNTPLTYAIAKNKLKIVETLINSGADINQRDAYGFTPLSKAISKGNTEIVSFLARKGVNFNQVSNKEWRTPMVLAIKMNNVEMLKCVIENGGSLNSRDSSGWCLMHRAMVAGRKGNAEMVKLLIAKSKNIKLNSSCCSCNRTLLTYAIYQENLEIVEALVNGWFP